MGDWRGKTGDCCKNIDWKVVDEKLSDPMGVLGVKSTPCDWSLKSQRSWARHETWKSKDRSFD